MLLRLLAAHLWCIVSMARFNCLMPWAWHVPVRAGHLMGKAPLAMCLYVQFHISVQVLALAPTLADALSPVACAIGLCAYNRAYRGFCRFQAWRAATQGDEQ